MNQFFFILEDQYATALMHDPNLVYKVKLHRAPMRHRYHFHYVIILIVYAKAKSNLINVQLT